MPRFYVDPAAGDAIRGGTVTIAGPLLHHLRDVLRYRPHDTLPLFDDCGRQYTVRIQRVTREALTAEVLDESTAPPPAVEITLGLGVVKGPRMDWLVQKATELGVSRLAPLLTQRTVIRAGGPPANEAALRQQRRWQRIAIAAAQQAETGRIPVIDPPEPFEAFLKAEREAGLKVIFWEAPDQQRQPLHQVCRRVCRESRPARAVGLVGPEGGFVPEEVAAARTHGFVPVTLGRRILRTETAGLVALALLCYELGTLE